MCRENFLNYQKLDTTDMENWIKISNHPSPKEKSSIFVSSFGNTMSVVNGRHMPLRDLDWYYKGHGGGIIQNKENVVFPKYGLKAGIETEILTMHYIDHNLNPVFVGYTLGLDISYKGLRSNDSFLSNFSHLSQTVVSNKIIEQSYPKSSIITTEIIRDNKIIWCVRSLAGSKNMNINPNCMFHYLFRNKDILLPNMIFYSLTGSATSIDKADILIKDNDQIRATLDDKKIILSNTFRDEI